MNESLRAQVYAWAFRLLGNHHDAMDVTQDIMVVWLGVDRSRIECERAWLRRTTTNRCIDLMRKRRPSAAGEAPHQCENAADPPALDRTELAQAVAKSLEMLTEQQRCAVIAKVYDRETFAKIAESMGISLSTAKTHYLRGLQALRSKLASFRD